MTDPYKKVVKQYLHNLLVKKPPLPSEVYVSELRDVEKQDGKSGEVCGSSRQAIEKYLLEQTGNGQYTSTPVFKADCASPFLLSRSSYYVISRPDVTTDELCLTLRPRDLSVLIRAYQYPLFSFQSRCSMETNESMGSMSSPISALEHFSSPSGNQERGGVSAHEMEERKKAIKKLVNDTQVITPVLSPEVRRVCWRLGILMRRSPYADNTFLFCLLLWPFVYDVSCHRLEVSPYSWWDLYLMPRTHFRGSLHSIQSGASHWYPIETSPTGQPLTSSWTHKLTLEPGAHDRRQLVKLKYLMPVHPVVRYSMEELHELCVWYGRIHAEWMAFVYAVSPSVSVSADEGECAYDTFFCIIFSLHDPNIWMQQSELSTLSYGTLWTFMYQQNLEGPSSGVHFNELHTPSYLGRVDPYTLEYRKDKSFSCVSELLFYIDDTHFQCANVYGNGYQTADPHQEKGAYVLRIPYSQLSK